MRKNVNLLVFGTNCIVSDSKGREITRREGFEKPSLFVVRFPKIAKFSGYKVTGNCEVKNAKILETKRLPIVLPAPEKNVTSTKIKNFVHDEKWHSPASINTKKGIFVYNNIFKNSSFCDQLFIFFHEKGHFFYNTEKYCDLYATCELFANGYGMSQAIKALRKNLANSPMKEERIKFVLDKLEPLKKFV